MNDTLAALDVLDRILGAWAMRRGVRVRRSFTDRPIRAVSLTGRGGGRFQILVDQPDRDGHTLVRAAGPEGTRTWHPADLNRLEAALEDAYEDIRRWNCGAGA